jgi:hypothetical protein
MSTENFISKQNWLAELIHTHTRLMEYVEALPDADLIWSEEGRWNALQQIKHVYLCLSTISQALSSKEYIEQKFGRIDRPTLTYDEVIERYKSGLAAGGKAPDRFVPDSSLKPSQKDEIIGELNNMLLNIQKQLESYSDDECNSLVLPHPFVGKLTIKELFFLMTEHANIHRNSIDRALNNR